MSELSTKQHRAMVALLEGATLKRAAEQAEISERQMYRWLHDTDFLTELQHGQDAILQIAFTRLMCLADSAINGLKSVLDNPGSDGSSVLYKSSVAVLQMLTDIDARQVEKQMLTRKLEDMSDSDINAMLQRH